MKTKIEFVTEGDAIEMYNEKTGEYLGDWTADGIARNGNDLPIWGYYATKEDAGRILADDKMCDLLMIARRVKGNLAGMTPVDGYNAIRKAEDKYCMLLGWMFKILSDDTINDWCKKNCHGSN